MHRRDCLQWLISTLLAGMLAACCAADTERSSADVRALPGSPTPQAAVTDLLAHLRRNELAQVVDVALPPDLHRQVDEAWRAGHSRWPLTELPLDDNIPKLLETLNRPLAEQALQSAFERQLAGQTPALQEAAHAMGLFGKEYLRRDGDYSLQDRQHYVQVVDVVSSWARTAPLGERERGRQTIHLLVNAAEQSGVRSDEDFSRLGMRESLDALVPLYIAIKQVLALYGLGIDAALASVRAEVVSQAGDKADVQVRYQLAGREIVTVIQTQQVAGRWYLLDYLDAARDSSLARLTEETTGDGGAAADAANAVPTGQAQKPAVAE